MARIYTNRADYEWIVEEVDIHGDIVNVNHDDSFEWARAFYLDPRRDPEVATRRLALTWVTQTGQKLWAYVNDDLTKFSIGTHFKDAYGHLTPIAIPLWARDEVMKWRPPTEE